MKIPKGLLLRIGPALLAVSLASSAAADVAPGPPPPDCAGKPDGTPCTLSNGTAGNCQTQKSDRQPGREWVFCKPDPHECDHLELGAACHGYLGRPAHCKEFSNAERKTTWRTCQVDGVDAPPAPGAPGTAAGGPAGSAEKKGMLSCAAAPGGAASTSALSLWGLLLCLAATRRARA